jgi:hypothetical protein
MPEPGPRDLPSSVAGEIALVVIFVLRVNLRPLSGVITYIRTVAAIGSKAVTAMIAAPS